MSTQRAYKEALVILKEVDCLQYIPSDIIYLLENMQDKNYSFVYDSNKSIEDQNVSRETMIILSVLYIRFLCNSAEEKAQLRKVYEKNEFIQNDFTKLLNQNVGDNDISDIKSKEVSNDLLNVFQKKSFIDWVKGFIFKLLRRR